MLRNQIAEKTEDGTKAEEYIMQGHLVPDELMLKLMNKELMAQTQSWLLDGNFLFIFVVYWNEAITFRMVCRYDVRICSIITQR